MQIQHNWRWSVFLGNKLKFMALACTLILTGCASITEYDWAMMGNPTPALAFYSTQMKHAQNVCVESNEKEASDRLNLYGVTRGLALEYYREKSPPFAKNEADFSMHRLALWSDMSSEQKNTFCSQYKADIQWSKEKNVLQLVQLAMLFRVTFSPASEDRVRHAQNAQVLSGVMALGLLGGSISQTNQGNFGSAKQLSNQATPFIGSVGKGIGVECNLYAPFIQINKNLTDKYFMEYYSIAHCS